jgi:hypothetical protein
MDMTVTFYSEIAGMHLGQGSGRIDGEVLVCCTRHLQEIFR